MNNDSTPKKGSRILGPAIGRLVNRGLCCLDCMDMGSQKGLRCQTCRPPRTPRRPAPEEDL